MFKETPIQIYMKPSSGGGGPGVHSHQLPSHTHSNSHTYDTHSNSHAYGRPTLFDKVTFSDITMCFNHNGTLDILKNRLGFVSDDASLENAINTLSYILSRLVFKRNHIKIFEQGLKEEIEISIRDTIKKYHKKEVLK